MCAFLAIANKIFLEPRIAFENLRPVGLEPVLLETKEEYAYCNKADDSKDVEKYEVAVTDR